MTTEEKIDKAVLLHNEFRSLCVQIDDEVRGAIEPRFGPPEKTYDTIRLGDGSRLKKHIQESRAWREAFNRVLPEDRQILFGI